MPRVREIENPGDDPILKETWAKEQDAFGFVLNTMHEGASEEKIARVAEAATSPLFSEPERAALEYAEAMTVTGRKVDDVLFARVRAQVVTPLWSWRPASPGGDLEVERLPWSSPVGDGRGLGVFHTKDLTIEQSGAVTAAVTGERYGQFFAR